MATVAQAIPVHLSETCGAICFGIWTYLAFFRGGFWRFRERLPKAPGVVSRASVTAVIPARDERPTIASTVASLRAQGEIAVIVADDESSDGTGDAACGAGAQVVRVPPLPAGWKGKLWAVSAGMAAAGTGPDYFLLTDADIEYRSPGVVPALLAQAERGFDLVSLMVHLRCESTPEKLLIPAFVFFFFMLYPPAWVASGAGPAAAAGGCMLIRREMLERIGGIAAIRNELIDDCALAAAVRRAGGRVWLGTAGRDVLSLRSYGASAEIRAMIARSAFTQLRHSAPVLAGALLGLFFTYLLPPVLMLSGNRVAAAMGCLAWLMSAILFLPAVGNYGAPPATAFCLPAIALFYLIATVESAILYWTGRGGQWKGRTQDRIHPSANTDNLS
jgi:hopene-associated glycosyltransferase HpnB